MPGGVNSAWALARLAQLPPAYPLEVAFAGRSNVGKSSLLNALTGRKDIARTSNTPGRTRELNYFELAEGAVALVDMPGYGYARASKTLVKAWQSIIMGYLQGTAEPAPGIRADRIRATASRRSTWRPWTSSTRQRSATRSC